MLYGSLDGRGVWKRMDLCLCMAESLTLHPKLSQYCLLISCAQYKIKSLKKSSPCSAQLEKACAQQWRPSTTEILKNNTWRGVKSAPLCGTYPPQALGVPTTPHCSPTPRPRSTCLCHHVHTAVFYRRGKILYSHISIKGTKLERQKRCDFSCTWLASLACLLCLAL